MLKKSELSSYFHLTLIMRHFILYLLFNFKQFNHDHASKLRPNCQDFVCPSVLEYIFSCPKSNHPKFELSHQRSKFMKIYFIMYLIKFIRYCKHHCSFLQIWSNLGWFVLRQLKIHYIQDGASNTLVDLLILSKLVINLLL